MSADTRKRNNNSGRRATQLLNAVEVADFLDESYWDDLDELRGGEVLLPSEDDQPADDVDQGKGKH